MDVEDLGDPLGDVVEILGDEMEYSTPFAASNAARVRRPSDALAEGLRSKVPCSMCP